MITSFLMLLKLGIYAPNPSDMPFPAWGYIAVNPFPQKTGVELGVTPEFVKREDVVMGRKADTYVVKPAWFLGLKQYINEDLDVALGAKYNERFYPYFGISLKFSSIVKKQRQINRKTRDTKYFYDPAKYY